MLRQLLLALAVFVCGALVTHAHAQATGGDPPSRAARLSDATGQVWLYNADANEWTAVERNQPLTTGDRIATDTDARAEITLGTTTLRLDAVTELEVVRLNDTRYVVRLQSGSVVARLRNPQALAEFELDTDEGRFRVQSVGRFRFDHLDQASDATALSGQAIFENANTALPVGAGQHAQFWLDASGLPQYAMLPPVRDAFAAWNDERDRAEVRVATPRFVSPEMTGAEDLDRYGQWQQAPDYGPIWVPAAVPAGWAPYTTGHWAWVRPWGWTWVDDARWGFAPFHYGRWVRYRDAWCWAPGTYVARPVYAPALVAWIGGPRVGVSLTLGGGAPVGWFPLAPREVYVPSYRASPRYVREVNITHVTNVTTITNIVNNRNGEADRRDFANRKFANAVTFVPAEVLTRRQPVGPAAARFRNDPQVRAFAAEGRPAPVLTAPPVTGPAAAPRVADGRQPPRPPFAARAPGNFAGRPEGTRPEAGRAEGARPEAGRGIEGRPGFGRGGERPGMPPATVASPATGTTSPGAVPATGVAQPGVMGAPGRSAPTSPTLPQPRVVQPPTAQPAIAQPPVAVLPTVVEPTARPAFRGNAARDTPANEGRVAQPVAPPNAVQRNVERHDGAGRPGFSPRDSRPAADANVGVPHAAPIPSLPIPNPAIPGAAGLPRPERTIAPRLPEPGRVEAVRPPVVNRAPEAAVVAPPAQRAAEVPRPSVGEARMARPEPPRNREQTRDERRDEKGAQQR